jgi:hypothetical protein
MFFKKAGKCLESREEKPGSVSKAGKSLIKPRPMKGQKTLKQYIQSRGRRDMFAKDDTWKAVLRRVLG